VTAFGASAATAQAVSVVPTAGPVCSEAPGYAWVRIECLLCIEVQFCVTGGWYAASLLQVLPMPVLLVARRVSWRGSRASQAHMLFIHNGVVRESRFRRSPLWSMSWYRTNRCTSYADSCRAPYGAWEIKGADASL
jgi:hypothetical protein